MTLRNLYFKLIKQEMKYKIWCPILILISFFLGMEVQLLITLQDMERWPTSYDYTSAHYVANNFMAIDQNLFFTIATVVTAILCGLVVFSYVHSRQKLDTYHSLPVGRNILFFAKYTAGVLFYLIPSVIHLLICLVIAYGKGAFSIHGVNGLLGLMSTELIIFLLCYSMTIICIMLTGNLVISVLATAVLQSYSVLIWFLKMIMYEKFYYTAVSNYIGPVWAFSPFHMVYNLMEIARTYRTDNTGFSYTAIWDYAMVLVGATVLFTIVGLMLYRKRPTEAAGRTIAFGITEPVIKCMIVIPFSLFSGYFFTRISSQNDFAWYLFGILFGFIISCLFLEIVFRSDIKSAFYHWQHIIFNAACVVLIILIFDNDAMGYNTYVPAKDELASCAVSIESLLETNYYAGSRSENYRMEHMELTGNDYVLELAQKLASTGLHYKEYDYYYEGLYETAEYKATELKEENYRSILFGYHLVNGKTIYRRYYFDITNEESRQLVAEVFNDIDYKLGSTPIFTNGWNKEIKKVSCVGQFDEKTFLLDQSQQNKLMDAYQTEYMKLTFDEVLQDTPIGVMNFTFEEPVSARHGISYSTLSFEEGYVVYPQFVRTIALLKEYGFDFIEAQTTQRIEEIKVRNYRYDYDYTYFSEAPTVTYAATDAEKLQEIVENVTYFGLVDFGQYMPVDDKYEVEITYIDQNVKQTQYYIFKKERIPFFVEEDMRAVEQEYDLAVE